ITLALTRIVVQGLRFHSVKLQIAVSERCRALRLRKACLFPVWTQPRRSRTWRLS
ncbi:hypothetical protein HPB47_006212, partial [Ixodes persulcatus]